MLMVFWSGWGIAIIPIAVLSLLASIAIGAPIADALAASGDRAIFIMFAGASLLAAVATFALCKWREAVTAETVFDEVSQTTMKLRYSAGTLVFVPMRIWMWLFVVSAPLLALGYFR